MMVISDSFTQQVIANTCTIQQIPAPTFHEEKRAAWMADSFRSHGLTQVEIDPSGNVYGRIPGGSDRPLVISAHLDTVHPFSTDLSLQVTPNRITGPGIGDNALGLAGLLAVSEMFLKHPEQLAGDIWLSANVCEEGLGDLRGAQALVNRFSSRPKAYLFLEGMGLGRIFHRGLGVIRYKITLCTPGGHSWANFGTPSAIHEMARLIQQITAIPLPSHPRTTFNIGVIHGGTSINTIASEASIELDLRSESSDQLTGLQKRVLQIVDRFQSGEVSATAEMIGARPAGEIEADHPLVLLTARCYEEAGVAPQTGIASTDANIALSRRFPAVCIGLTEGARAHTAEEYIELAPLTRGLCALQQLILRIWR